MAADMRALIEAATGPLPYRRERYRVGELIAYCRTQAPTLEPAAWDLALVHERRAMQVATLEAGALEALAGARGAGVATALWTNNARALTLPALDRRDRGAGAPPGARPRAAGGHRDGRAAFDDPLGPPGLRQDDARLVDGPRDRRPLRRLLGRPVGRQGDPRGDRRGRPRARPSRDADHPLRRRDPSVQPRPAGRVSPPRREG